MICNYWEDSPLPWCFLSDIHFTYQKCLQLFWKVQLITSCLWHNVRGIVCSIVIEPWGEIKPMLQMCSVASLHTHRIQQALSLHPASLVIEMSPPVLSLVNCQGFINMELERWTGMTIDMRAGQDGHMSSRTCNTLIQICSPLWLGR